MKITGFLSMSLLVLVFAFSDASEPGTDVSRQDAMAISGGGCGGVVATKTKNCEGTDGEICDGVEVLCSTASTSVTVIEGDGDREKKTSTAATCDVCGNQVCSWLSSVDSTKKADCDG
jgi:hypothetical protein